MDKKMFTISRTKPRVTHSEWVDWARETFTCLNFYFDYNVFGQPSNDMLNATLDIRLPDWAKWRTVKREGVLPIEEGKQYLVDNKHRRMLTKKEIKKIKHFNLFTAQEGLRQAEQRLNHCLETKRDIESKTRILLSIFVSITVALFSVPQILNIDKPTVYWATMLTGICVLFSVLCLLRSLKTLGYGTLGRYPDTWLQPGVLDGDDDMRAYVLANVLHDYQTSIGTSDNSNRDKVKWFNKGIILGVAVAPVAFLFCLLAPYVMRLVPCVTCHFL